MSVASFSRILLLARLSADRDRADCPPIELARLSADRDRASAGKTPPAAPCRAGQLRFSAHFLRPVTGQSLTFHCLSLAFPWPSTALHCLSLTFHCLSLTFHCFRARPPRKIPSTWNPRSDAEPPLTIATTFGDACCIALVAAMADAAATAGSTPAAPRRVTHAWRMGVWTHQHGRASGRWFGRQDLDGDARERSARETSWETSPARLRSGRGGARPPYFGQSLRVPEVGCSRPTLVRRLGPQGGRQRGVATYHGKERAGGGPGALRVRNRRRRSPVDRITSRARGLTNDLIESHDPEGLGAGPGDGPGGVAPSAPLALHAARVGRSGALRLRACGNQATAGGRARLCRSVPAAEGQRLNIQTQLVRRDVRSRHLRVEAVDVARSRSRSPHPIARAPHRLVSRLRPCALAASATLARVKQTAHLDHQPVLPRPSPARFRSGRRQTICFTTRPPHNMLPCNIDLWMWMWSTISLFLPRCQSPPILMVMRI